VAIIVRKGTASRLAGTCFRGKEHRLAGNFARWNDALEMLEDADFRDPFLDDVLEVVSEDDLLEHAYELEIEVEKCGWSSTDDISKFSPRDVEVFNPNRHTLAYRVKSDIGVRAPLVDVLTVKYEIKLEDSGWVVVIHTVYPGENIGRLTGNVSQREQIVFYDWSHPGA
jgi:hypothetical protein